MKISEDNDGCDDDENDDGYADIEHNFDNEDEEDQLM